MAVTGQFSELVRDTPSIGMMRFFLFFFRFKWGRVPNQNITKEKFTGVLRAFYLNFWSS